VKKKRSQSKLQTIEDVINRIHKVGGVVEFRTLRRSKIKVRPRKILISITIPIVGKYEDITALSIIANLKDRSIYKGCITEIKQTSPKYCAVTFSFILKSPEHLTEFTNMLCKIAFDTKSEVESILDV